MLHSRSELIVDISQLTQATELQLADDQRTIIKRLFTIIKYTNNNPAQMTYPKIDIATLSIIGHSDVVFANYKDLTSQSSKIVFLSEANGHNDPMVYSIHISLDA